MRSHPNPLHLLKLSPRVPQISEELSKEAVKLPAVTSIGHRPLHRVSAHLRAMFKS
jgi:hypothetical protein